MNAQSFKPIVYLLEPCPFCLKLMIFLQEGGLLDDFEMRSFTPGSPEADAIRAELEPNVEKVTFPTVQIAPGSYLNGSDELINFYAPKASKPVTDMRLLSYYLGGVFPAYGQLFRENMQLKAAAAEGKKD